MILPTPEERLLLRACLLPGEFAVRGWDAWKASRDGLRMERDESIRKLRLLVFRASQSHGFQMDKECRTFLRSAFLREELRNKVFRQICREVILLLKREGIPAIVLKGAALADSVYEIPVLRHCHDLEILVRGEDQGRAVEQLNSLSFCRMKGVVARAGICVLRHGSGLPLQLHTQLFEVPVYNLPIPELWERSQRSMVAGSMAQILSPADNLLHICGHASYSSSCRSLHWVTDACFLLQRHQDLDWDSLLSSACRHHLIVPLSMLLGYLSRELEAPIPMQFLNRLHFAASRAGYRDREAAMWGVVAQGCAGSQAMIRSAPNWRVRFSIIRWLLFPSPGYLRWAEHIHFTWLLPAYYLYRPLKFALRRIRNAL